MNLAISSFLIHYTKLQDRLHNALNVLSTVGLHPEIVSCWDGDNLPSIKDGYSPTESLWLSHVMPVASILLANAGYKLETVHYNTLQNLVNSPDHARSFLPQWMHPRSLSTGEISVLLKHYYAISRIAQGQHSYGLVAEDDLILHPLSKTLFHNSFQELRSEDGDYLDLAGGCGLFSDDAKLKYIALISPPSTRTNACYILSKRLAILIVERFFPVSTPIDWHLLYILNSLDTTRCFWAKQECFIHGSENGAYQSWRRN